MVRLPSGSAGSSDGSDNSCVERHDANAGVLEVTNIDVPCAGDGSGNRVPKQGPDGWPIVVAEAIDTLTRYCFDDSATGADLLNPRPGAGEMRLSPWFEPLGQPLAAVVQNAEWKILSKPSAHRWWR